MLVAMREHALGALPAYEARFRLRSNGSGYRLMHSRGRIIERNAEGRALRMVGTMLDLTGRSPSPRSGLPDGPRGSMEGAELVSPFHRLLASSTDARITAERDRVLSLVGDLLHVAVADLEALRTQAR